MTADCDVAIVGAGAAGLATAIATRRRHPDVRVVLLDGAKRPGAKILVSGGTRCNVTNVDVTERDFNGGRPALVRRVLKAFSSADAVAFFAGIGVGLHEEPGGKLFPDTNRARDVLDALLREIARLGVDLRAGCRVHDIRRTTDGFEIDTDAGPLTTPRVVLATGGLSLPKTGSDGWGYDVARRLGHTIVPTSPALAPLMVQASSAIGTIPGRLSGVAQDARIDIRVAATVRASVRGSLLWTHFGISGPAALDASRHWLRARLEGDMPTLTLALLPDERFESLDSELTTLARTRPRASVPTALASLVPASVADALVDVLPIRPGVTLAELSRDDRRVVVRAMLELALPIADSRGYDYAEVTAGGVPLGEVDLATMASRVCPRLSLVGEILDVDGRIGGFNFQWAWATAHVAGQAIGRREAASEP